MSAPPDELPAAGLTLSIQLGPSTARQPLEPPASGSAPRGCPSPPPAAARAVPAALQRERDRAATSSRRCDVTRARRARPSPPLRPGASAEPSAPLRHTWAKKKQTSPLGAAHESYGIPALLTLSSQIYNSTLVPESNELRWARAAGGNCSFATVFSNRFSKSTLFSLLINVLIKA